MSRLLDAIEALRARAEAAETEAARLAEQLAATNARLAEYEEEIARLSRHEALRRLSNEADELGDYTEGER